MAVPVTTAAGRFARPAAVVVLALGLVGLLLTAVPATAAGTGGIEVSPYPGVVDGKQVTAFHAELPRDGKATKVKYSLRNTTNEPRTAKLYAASAAKDGKGGFTVGDVASSPYISFPTRDVTLAGGKSELGEFEVHGKLDEDAYGAIVVEVMQGAVTQRAATIVYLSPGPVLPIPVLLAIGAAILVLAGGFGVWLVRRRTA